MSDAMICDPGGGGKVLPLFTNENDAPKGPRAFFYFTLLCWSFLGVSIIADIFMAAIEKVTSKKKIKTLSNGKEISVKVWNDTVANLTLMALGSSAPEILLNVIEIVAGFKAGELGPSTIVGSAAFNLLVIIAVCVYVIPDGQTRTIKSINVFLVTAFFSVFAYVWLIAILAIISPEIIDVWEGVVTFLMFPLMVVLAYLADIGKLQFMKEPGSTQANEDFKVQLLEAYGGELKDDDVQLLADASKAKETSRAHFRMDQSSTQIAHITEVPMGQLSVAFLSTHYTFPSTAASSDLTLEVEVLGTLAGSARVGIEYITRDVPSGDAKKGRIEVAESGRGRLVLKDAFPKVEPCTFYVDLTQAVMLKDSKKALEDAELAAALIAKDRKKVKITGKLRHAKVVIAENDKDVVPGQLKLENSALQHVPHPSDPTVARIKVTRFNGSAGEISCVYATKANSARPGMDYEHVEGTLTFPPGVLEKVIEIPISCKGKYEKEDCFELEIADAPGHEEVVVEDSKNCNIHIKESSPDQEAAVKVMRALDAALNLDSITEGNVAWADQWRRAMSPTDGEDEEASMSQWTLHFIALPWKLIFALVPPTSYCGGWLCFCIAITFIGGLTAIIGDLAELLGCCIGMPNAITAITIVALGTSLPDTFASKVAAVEEKWADMAIGNVTGSNGVNVFLGLGLPWMMASIYWAAVGRTDSWNTSYEASFAGRCPNGCFVVPAGDLVFSVGVFTICALTAIGVIWYRRKAFQAELGGPSGVKTNTSVFFVLLWALYVGVASWKVMMGDSADAGMMIIAVLVGICGVALGMVLISSFIFFLQSRQASREQHVKDVANQVLLSMPGLAAPSGAPAATPRSTVMAAGIGAHWAARARQSMTRPNLGASMADADDVDLREAVQSIRQHVDGLKVVCDAMDQALLEKNKEKQKNNGNADNKDDQPGKTSAKAAAKKNAAPGPWSKRSAKDSE